MDLSKGIAARCFLLSLAISLSNTAYYDDEKSLRTAVLNNYEYKIRPAETVTVNVKLHLLNINLLDVPTQQLSVSGWLTFTWSDERLTWTPATYANIEDFYDTESVLWRPEIIVDNSVDNLGVISDSALLIRATYQGEMTWEPPGIFETHCDVDVTYYPFDTQLCRVEVTSWAYTLAEVDLQASETTINFEDYQISGEWDVLESYTERQILIDGADQHSEVVFTMKIQRKPAYYITTILLPVIVTSLLCGLVFLLPVDSGEKVGYSLTVLLTYSVIISLVASYMPPTSKHTSVLSVYNTIILFVGSFTVGLTVFVIYCYHQPEDEEPPSWLLALTRGFLIPVARFCGGSNGRASKFGAKERRGSSPDISNRLDNPESRDRTHSDVRIVGLGGKKPNNTVHPQTPTKVRTKLDDATRRQSYQYGNLHNVSGASSDKGNSLAWQDISIIIDSACMRIFTIFVSLLTIIVLMVLIIGGYLA